MGNKVQKYKCNKHKFLMERKCLVKKRDLKRALEFKHSLYAKLAVSISTNILKLLHYTFGFAIPPNIDTDNKERHLFLKIIIKKQELSTCLDIITINLYY